VGVGYKVADYLENGLLLAECTRIIDSWDTWSADIPLMSAFLTLSRVMEPTTRFGKRYFKVTKRFNTAVCSGLSKENKFAISSVYETPS